MARAGARHTRDFDRQRRIVLTAAGVGALLLVLVLGLDALSRGASRRRP